jgi:uncharacterized protein YxeA
MKNILITIASIIVILLIILFSGYLFINTILEINREIINNTFQTYLM